MKTADDYRTELEQFKATVTRTAEQAVRDGYVTQTQADQVLESLGLRVEDAETRAAREELEAFRTRTREAVDALGLHGTTRDGALRRLGL